MILFVLLLVSVFMGAFNSQSAKVNANSQRKTAQAADPAQVHGVGGFTG